MQRSFGNAHVSKPDPVRDARNIEALVRQNIPQMSPAQNPLTVVFWIVGALIACCGICLVAALYINQ
jgi:hypothetical protein